MVKSSPPALKSYHTSIINFAKTKWVLALFLVPIGIYSAFLVLETELTNFIIPFFPKEPDKSFGFYRDFVELCFNEILWLSFFLFLTWVFLVFIPLENVIKTVEKQVSEKPVFLVSLIIGLSFFTSIIISYYTLKTFPNSADEYVYLIQAETLSHGKLWQSSHELYNFFHFNHIAQKDDISVGRFPPGWPLLLSIPFIFKIPAFLINPVLGLFSLIMFYSFVRRLYTLRIAIWSLVSLALTSFFIFNSASFFSHTSCLLITLGFVYCIHLAQEKPSIQYGLAAGIFLGMIVITRSFNAVLIFIPVSIYLLHRNRLRSIPVFFWIGIGTLPFFLFLFWYNDKITGNGLLPVTVWADSSESLGFVHGHSFIKGIDHFIRRVFMFLYWCSPALLILYFIFLWRKIWDKTDRLTHPEDYYFLLLIIGYFFYHHIGGNQYGPRFLFEALPFLIVFVVRNAFDMKRKWPLALLFAGLVYAALKLPFIAQREHRVVSERMDVFRLTSQEKITNAVVLISTHTGVIRPMPIRDLTRNDEHYNNSVIYAQNIPAKNDELMKYYPDRSFYKYVRDPEQVKGKLVKLK